MIDKFTGDAATRKDADVEKSAVETSPTTNEPQLNPNGAPPPSHPYPRDNSSGYPVVDEKKLESIAFDVISIVANSGKAPARYAVMDAIRPYLRTTEPVSGEVDIAAGAAAIFTERNGGWDFKKYRSDRRIREAYCKDAEACAKAWGLKWK